MAEKISNNLIEVKRMLHIEDGNMIYGFLNFCEKILKIYKFYGYLK